MSALSVGGAVAGGVGTVVAGWQAQAAVTGNAPALIAAVAAVIVALIGGAVAVLTARRQVPPEPPPVRYVDPPTSYALHQELTELTAEAMADARAARDAQERAVRRADLWESRARKLGWKDGR